MSTVAGSSEERLRLGGRDRGSDVRAGTLEAASESLPRRDYIILPMLGLATILLMLIASEVGSRIVWPRQETDTCRVRENVGVRYRSNCSSVMKDAEGPWTTNRYNECGYRTNARCGPKPAGALRIVLLGSSSTQGAYVPYDQTFAARVSDSVARDLNRQVQIENLAVQVPPVFSPLDSYLRLTEAIKLEPDALVFVVSPLDLAYKMNARQFAQRDNPNASFNEPTVVEKQTALASLRFQLLREESTSVVMAQHYLFQNTGLWVPIVLASGGDKNGYLRQPFTAGWEASLADLQTLVDEMGARLRAKGIPLIVLSLPSRLEAALFRLQYRQPHVDPFAFGNRIHDIAKHAGATYVDLVQPFSQLPRPEDLYYTVDKHHPTGEGHAVIARELTPVVESVLTSHIDPAKEKN